MPAMPSRLAPDCTGGERGQDSRFGWAHWTAVTPRARLPVWQNAVEQPAHTDWVGQPATLRAPECVVQGQGDRAAFGRVSISHGELAGRLVSVRMATSVSDRMTQVDWVQM
jgi:hypothetical protein